MPCKKSLSINAMRLEELRAEIKKGLDSGEATPLDIGAIKARGRKRLAAARDKVSP
jgi:antitoxin ParD1/3/4